MLYRRNGAYAIATTFPPVSSARPCMWAGACAAHTTNCTFGSIYCCQILRDIELGLQYLRTRHRPATLLCIPCAKRRTFMQTSSCRLCYHTGNDCSSVVEFRKHIRFPAIFEQSPDRLTDLTAAALAVTAVTPTHGQGAPRAHLSNQILPLRVMHKQHRHACPRFAVPILMP